MTLQKKVEKLKAIFLVKTKKQSKTNIAKKLAVKSKLSPDS